MTGDRSADPIEKALSELHYKRTFPLTADSSVVVALLMRKTDWRPLKAPWWQKKEAYIIGADLSGNFFLRHCDGSVRYWNHGTQKDDIIAASVAEFCSKLVAGPES